MSEAHCILKGIILAGGAGNRLHPTTRAINKHLLPVYDKPLIYYPLSTLMLAGIRQVLMICTPESMGSFQRLLGDGGQLGLQICYAEQPKPEGLAQAFIIGQHFVGSDAVALVLGDNIFYGERLQQLLIKLAKHAEGATICGYRVKQPQRYGVVELAPDGTPLSIEEKPTVPKSVYAVTGLYFYDNQVLSIAAQVSPSSRGELEITDINREYLRRGELRVHCIGRGVAWLDAGTHESLLDASKFVRMVEERQGQKIGCLEEIAFRQHFISATELMELARHYNNDYREYLFCLIESND